MHRAPQQTRTYHVTTTTAQRRRLFQVHATADLLRQTLLHYRDQGRYRLHAFVIMPDHLHVLLTPHEEVSLEKAIQFIKGGFSFRLKTKQEIWLRSFNETQIQSAQQYAECKRYIEANPVRKFMVLTPELYAYSSASLNLDQAPVHFYG